MSFPEGSEAGRVAREITGVFDAHPHVHPAQLYGALGGFLVFGLLLWWERLSDRPGETLGRFLTHGGRAIPVAIVQDEHGAQSSSATVTVTVTGTNDGPVAVADTAAVMEAIVAEARTEVEMAQREVESARSMATATCTRADVAERGIVLVGGGSLLPHIDVLLREVLEALDAAPGPGRRDHPRRAGRLLATTARCAPPPRSWPTKSRWASRWSVSWSPRAA